MDEKSENIEKLQNKLDEKSVQNTKLQSDLQSAKTSLATIKSDCDKKIPSTDDSHLQEIAREKIFNKIEVLYFSQMKVKHFYDYFESSKD